MMSLVLTPSAAESVLTVIGSSISIGSPFSTAVLAMRVRAASFDLVQVPVKTGAEAGGGVEALLALDQVGVGELLELLHRLAATTVAAATAIRMRPALGGCLFLFCFLVIFGRLDARPPVGRAWVTVGPPSVFGPSGVAGAEPARRRAFLRGRPWALR